MGHPTPRQSCHWALQREDRWPWTAPTGGPLDNVQRHVIWLIIFARTSFYFIDVIHISYTIHTHIIHIQDILIFLCGMPFFSWRVTSPCFFHEIPKKKCWSPVRWPQRNSPWRLARRCCARRHRRSAEAGVSTRGQPRQLPWDSKHLGYLKDLNPNKDSADSSWVCEPWSCSCTFLIWVHNNP